jgi:hypothetical protein
MDNSVQYSYDASLPCPDALVFDGLLYERTEDLVVSLVPRLAHLYLANPLLKGFSAKSPLY